MNDQGQGFRDRLLGAEPVSPSLKQRYDKEMQAMLEKPLSGVGRWVFGAAGAAGAGIALLFAAMAILLPADFPEPARWPTRLAFTLGALFGIGWAVLGLRVFRRRSIHLRRDTGMVAAMTWVFVVLMVTIFLVGAPDNLIGLRMIVGGLVFLVGGAVFLLRHVVELSELKTREKLLEIELRLIELADNVKPRADSRQQDA